MTKAKTKERAADAPVLFGDAEIKIPKVPAEPPAPKPPAKPARNSVVKFAPPPPPEDGTDDLIILARAAANPKVDPAKMQALREIMKDIRQERREEAFTRDFIALQAELPEIDKDGRIVIDPKETARNQKRQVTPFSTFENIHRVSMPILRRHNFSMWHEVQPGAGGVGVVVHSFLKHTGGHQTTSAIPLVLDTTGSKNNNQGAGSSISYGKRYNTIALLNIISKAPDDRDLDGAAPKPKGDAESVANPNATINGSQAKTLLEAINECGVEATVFMDKYGIKAVHELPLRFFDEAMKSCRDYAARVKASKERP